MNLIALKECIAIGEPLTPEQRDFVLDLINTAAQLCQLQAERDALANWQRNALKEINELRAARADDQQRLFHYENALGRHADDTQS